MVITNSYPLIQRRGLVFQKQKLQPTEILQKANIHDEDLIKLICVCYTLNTFKIILCMYEWEIKCREEIQT